MRFISVGRRVVEKVVKEIHTVRDSILNFAHDSKSAVNIKNYSTGQTNVNSSTSVEIDKTCGEMLKDGSLGMNQSESTEGSSNSNANSGLELYNPIMLSSEKNPNRTAWNATEINYEVVNSGAVTTCTKGVHAGRDDWQDEQNAEGTPDGSVATIEGELLRSSGGILFLQYGDIIEKEGFTIEEMSFDFYMSQSGTLFNNGDLEIVIKGLNSFTYYEETFTSNIDYMEQPYTVTINSSLSWEEVSKANAQITSYIGSGNVGINCEVDSVVKRVRATRRDVL